MGWTAILGVLFCLGLASSSLYTAHSRYKLSRTNYARIALLGRHGSLTSALQKNSTYSVKYFEQRVDHFNAADQRTFKQRYLVNQEEWEEGGPILLYTGNEGDITWFCNNTGFIFDLSVKLKALVIFIEHRYYGKSLPFGTASFLNNKYLGYLTSEQALADFAFLITEVKASVFNTSSPVIAMGGSYGGMLAAWMRMKYPHIVIGSLAASAPLWWFTGLTPCNSAALTITKDFEQATPGWPDSADHLCSDTVRKSWQAFTNVAKKAGGLQWLSNTFNLCQKLHTLYELLDWIDGTWFNLAMVDYPIPASFLEPLPAWPINKTCEFLSKPFKSDEELLQAVASSLGVYYNYTGQSECYSLTQDATPSLGDKGWSFQACTEMIMPQCSDGVTDMLRPAPWNLTAYGEYCQSVYKVTIQPHLIETLYGGKNISAHSNIIFSNGLLDPWHGGGVLHNISDTLVALTIPNGAHHLDLQGTHDNDPKEVTILREKETSIMMDWISQYYQNDYE